MKQTLIALFSSAAMLAGASAAFADDTSSNLTVRATLTNGCGINFDGDSQTVDFGPITDLSNNVSRERSFTIKCTSGLKNPDGSTDSNNYAPTSVALNAGNVAGSTVANRLMANMDNASSTGTVQFQVYQGHQGSSVIWGDQPSGANAVYLTPDSTATYPFTVTLLGGQKLDGLTAGAYQNTMVATVNYSATPK